MTTVKMFDAFRDKNFILAGNWRRLDLLILEHTRMLAALESIEEMSDDSSVKKAKQIAALALGKEQCNQTKKDEITTKDGLLWRGGKIIDLPEADRVAEKLGFIYAEDLVKHLEAQKLRQ